MLPHCPNIFAPNQQTCPPFSIYWFSMQPNSALLLHINWSEVHNVIFTTIQWHSWQECYRLVWTKLRLGIRACYLTGYGLSQVGCWLSRRVWKLNWNRRATLSWIGSTVRSHPVWSLCFVFTCWRLTLFALCISVLLMALQNKVSSSTFCLRGLDLTTNDYHNRLVFSGDNLPAFLSSLGVRPPKSNIGGQPPC